MTSRIKALLSIACGVTAFVGFADAKIWKSSGAADYSDWTKGANFEGGVAPGAGDTVVIPEGVTVELKASDTASAACVDKLAAVQLYGQYNQGSPARLVVTVDACDPNDGVLSVGCKVRGADAMDNGHVEKYGSGEFFITDLNDTSTDTTSHYRWCCATSFTVHEGTLRFPQTRQTSGERELYRLHIAAGAKVVNFHGEGNYNAATITPSILTGAGLLTNEQTTVDTGVVLKGNEMGILTNEIVLGAFTRITPQNNVYLASTSNTVKGNIMFSSDKAHLWIPSNSATDGASTIGTAGLTVGAETAGIHYQGTGEPAVKRSMDIYDIPDGQTMTIDGGPYGGFCFDTYSYWRSRHSLANVILEGDGPLENAFLGYNQNVYDNKIIGLTFTKRGRGTWRLGDPSQSDGKDTGRWGLRGVYVEEGTLAADTLYDRGHMCAIGHSVTNLPYGYKGPFSDAFSGEKYVDYPLAIGGTNGTEGTFAFTGSAGVWLTNLPFAVVGNARLVNRSATAAFRHVGGISSRRAGTHKLTLDGDDAQECDIGNVTEQTGKLNLVKEGVGTWSLVGTNAFTGGIDVKAGTLKVAYHGAKYTWFKWVLKETYNAYYGKSTTSGDEREPRITEFGLYDANSNRVNGALTPVLDYRNIAPGQVSIVEDIDEYGNSWGPATSYATYMLDGTWTSDCTAYSKLKVGGGHSPSLADERTWVTFLMRLPENVAEVASYDVSYGYRYWGAPKAWALYGSTDGVVWDLLDEKAFTEGLPKTDVNAYWLLAKKDWSTPAAAAVHGGGQTIVGHAAATLPTLPTAQDHISVAQGATLVFDGQGAAVTKLVVDGVNGLGTISGLTCAAQGTVEFTNIDPHARKLSFPADLSGVTGVLNLNQWNVNVNGNPAGSRYNFKATEKGLTLSKCGFAFFVL